jgi:hypothetical protein
MAKSKRVMVMAKCVCSICQQVATSRPGTLHAFCKGVVPMLAKLGMFHPTRKGVWTPV